MEDYQQLYWTMKHDVIQAGFYSRAYYEFRDLFRDDPIKAQESLKTLLLDNKEDPIILEGILHLSHDFDYEEFNLVNDLILNICKESKDSCVIDKFISLCESWVNEKTKDILKNIHIEDKWLDDYRKAVLKDYEEEL